MADNNITANSEPDLDEWGWDSFWSCAEWVQWHQQLKAMFGKADADRRFVNAYFEQSFGASGYDCRSFNSAFRTYFQDENLLEALYGDLAALQLIGAATDVITSVSNAASNAGKGAENLSKVLKWLLPVTAIIVVLGAAYFLYKKYGK